MPRKEHVVTVFVASPSDLNLERGLLEETIQEQNISWAETLGLRLELIRWETRAHPAIDDEPQAVINKQIPNDYDIFIGIMWHRFGTPTKNAGSGTLEEFQSAKKRYDDDSSSIRIMFYFKDAPVPPPEIDPDQLAKIQAFRKSLGTKGVLYWTFDDKQQFEQLLRIHLARETQHALRKLKQDHNLPTTNHNDALRASGSDLMNNHEGPGLLELLDITEEASDDLRKTTERITSFTTDFGAKLNAHTENIQAAVAVSQSGLSRNKSKLLINTVADDMNHYVSQVEAELSPFAASMH